MGQFKPMVKMETTEPSVILKLKKGGHVNYKDGGQAESGHTKMAGGGKMRGALQMSAEPAFKGKPVVNASVKNPLTKLFKAPKPVVKAATGVTTRAVDSIARKEQDQARLKALDDSAVRLKAAQPMRRAKGGKADMAQDKAIVQKAMKQHDTQQHADKTKLKLKHGGKMATGGVAMSNAGGYKTGGVVNNKPGGYKTGGVAMANAGGYAKGGMVDTGKAEKMPQGMKKPSPPATGQINFSGAYANGGRATMAKPMAKPMAKSSAPMAVNHSSRALRDEVYKPQAKQMRTRVYKKGGNTEMC
jgi:hypothetical protein